MQILIDLSDAQIEAILHRAKQRGLTSAEVISETISRDLAVPEQEETSDVSRYVGLWAKHGKNTGMDALEYQDKLRAEWER